MIRITSMATDEPSSIQTRTSLLNRMKTDEAGGWNEFYRIYGKLVRGFAMQAGLSETEADDVMQETAIAIARHLPEYHYDRRNCRFKTWLLNQASWRVKDQLKKRNRQAAHIADFSNAAETSRTSAINRVPDSNSPDLAALFETEWRKNLLSVAMERVKKKFSDKQIQIFDFVVLQEWPASEVAKCTFRGRGIFRL